MRHYALISINQFHPNLCDGVSNTMLEILVFLKNRGHKASIFNFLTNEPSRKKIFDHYGRRIDLNGINIHQTLLPHPQKDIQNKPHDYLKIIMGELKNKKIDFAFTLEENGIALLAAFLLKIQGSHFFHSLAYIKSFPADSFIRDILRKRPVFSVSRFIQSKVKEKLNTDSIVWYPMIDFERCQTATGIKDRNAIGFYSGGKHKGDEIVNKIIEKMPEYDFVVMGRNYYQNFKGIPKNLTYLKDETEVKNFYSQIKILLVPSITEEAFSRVILEANANEIPVIANNVGGISEAIGNSEILVDINLEKELDLNEIVQKYIIKIRELMQNDQTYSKFSKRALLRARQFQAANNLNNELYQKYL